MICDYLVVVYIQIISVFSMGHFYFGMLGYENNSCDQCNLMFEIEVDGLNGSSGRVSKRPSTVPLSASQAETFRGDSIVNPLSFQFNRWPGRVDVTLIVTNISGSSVDRLSTSIALYEPSTYYFLKRLIHNNNKSSNNNNTSHTSGSTVVFRYTCVPTNGPHCFTDCADHDDNETCPVTSPAPTQLSPDVITFTGFTDSKCTTRDTDGNAIHVNCSTDGLTAQPTQLANASTTSRTSTPLSSSVSASVTSSKVFLDSGTTPNLIPNSESTSTERIHRTNRHITTLQKVVVSNSKSSTLNSSHFMTSIVTSQHVITQTVKGGITDASAADDGVETLDDDTAYWPAIVAGVLGGVALFAATAFVCYWNRHKKLQKRQEIYNVNPKILRNFEDFEENGTSGRADVPMETEQF